MSRFTVSRSTWQYAAAHLPLSRMNWWELRETVVYDPERRIAAWLEMSRRSVNAQWGMGTGRDRG